MEIIDSQIHMWGPEPAGNPWPPRVAQRFEDHVSLGRLSVDPREGLDPRSLLAMMDAVGVDAAILVPAPFAGVHNEAALEAAATHPSRFAVTGVLPLENPTETMARIVVWPSHPGALGFRLSFSKQSGAAHMLTDGSVEWLWSEAERRDLPLMVNVHGELEALAAVARRHPTLRIIVDHFGLFSKDRDVAAVAGVERLVGLAELPNVSVKASPAPVYTVEAYPHPTIQRLIERIVTAFGGQRVFWGSDLARLPCTYRECLDLFAREREFLSASDRELILGRGLAEWLRWTAGRTERSERHRVA